MDLASSAGSRSDVDSVLFRGEQFENTGRCLDVLVAPKCAGRAERHTIWATPDRKGVAQGVMWQEDPLAINRQSGALLRNGEHGSAANKFHAQARGSENLYAKHILNPG